MKQYLKNRQYHGLSDSTEYQTWADMKNRCYNQKNKRYKDYGGRSIGVCDRWMESFLNFLEDYYFFRQQHRIIN